MDGYRRKVKEAALKRSGEPIYNGSLDHASVLASALFEHAREEVCVLSGELNAHVYGTDDVLERARLFLSTRGRKIRVLVENPDAIDPKDHPFVHEFGGNDDVEFRQLSSAVNVPFHFIVMDGDSYRFEKDKSAPTAVAAFGDTAGGENLSRMFDILWGRGAPTSFATLS